MVEILIVDDEETLLATLSLELGRNGYRCHVAENAQAALAKLETTEPQIALVDVRLPDMDGLDLIRRIRQLEYDFPIVVMTAYGSVQSAVAAMKAGATDYLQKPVAIDELDVVIGRVLNNRRMRERLDVFEREGKRQGAERVIVGQSQPWLAAMALAQKIASVPPDADGHLPTVLLTGETGTGKDLIAHRIHEMGPHGDAPFVQINCTALPASLVEGELFGYEKGAFTDAKVNKKGLLEVASEGTVFLDEVGDTPLGLQAKLLLVLEQRTFRRLGGTREREVRARTIAATNCDLPKLVAEGRFRKDLLYRFESLAVELPPLRNRGDDLFLLAKHFIRQQALRLHREPPRLSECAKEAMRRYSWPGNVRELENVLQRAVLLQEGAAVTAADLHLRLDEPPPLVRESCLPLTDSAQAEAVKGLAPTAAAPSHTPALDPLVRESCLPLTDSAQAAPPQARESFLAPPVASSEPPPLSALRFPFAREACTLEAVERLLISQALEHCHGNISEAARLLGSSRGALRHRMEKLNLSLQPRKL